MNCRTIFLILFLLAIIRTICKAEGTPNGLTGSRGARAVPSVSEPSPLVGVASWYGRECAGRHTANGEVFHPEGYSCASWSYPFGTWLLVRNCATGAGVVVRVNDRGPARRLHRVIDLSEASFKQIADTRRGLVRVAITKLN